LVLGLVVMVAGTAWADDRRSLEGRTSAAGIDKVLLDAGVGDIDVIGIDGTDDVTVTVELEPRRGGFFSSMKKARREVEEAELRMDTARGVLRIEVETDSNDRHFEEDWTVELPSRLALAIDLGVGDVEVRNLAGALTIDIGVGDVDAEGVSHDVSIDLGVGDASIRATAADYGAVDGSGGVGDARLTVRGQRIESSGFVGHSAEWTGDGAHTIEISVGVGDARVTLE
jgi:hypothetical protein